MPRSVSARRARTVRLALALAAVGLVACTGPTAEPARQGAAYTHLFEALGRPAGLRLDGDSSLTVTRIETRAMRDADRAIAARSVARTVAREWPTGRLRHVTVIYRRVTRLGPFILRSRDVPVTVSDAGEGAARPVPGATGVPE